MKITIEINYTLAELKEAYKKYYGPKEHPKKAEIAAWLGSMVEADVDSIVSHEDVYNRSKLD